MAASGAAVAPSGGQVRRSQLALKDPTKLLAEIQGVCDPVCAPATLLRMHWYDAPPSGMAPSSEQTSLGMLPGIKLRLGNLNNQGQQKGVDSLIITDLIDFARNAAVSDVVLISGDEDLRVGVSIAQNYGIRIHLLNIGDARNNTSHRLVMESDSQVVLDQTWIQRVVEIRPQTQPTRTPLRIVPPTPALAMPGPPLVAPSSSPVNLGPVPTPNIATSGATLQSATTDVIAGLLALRNPAELASLKTILETPGSSIPAEYDRKLIAILSTELGRILTSGDKAYARKQFRAEVCK